MNIFIAKLSPNTDEDSLRSLFSQYGEVTSSKVIMDRDTGRSKCFGFIEMSDSEAMEAMDSLNDTEYQGSTIVVKKGQPKENSGGGNYNRGGGGGNSYNRSSGGGNRYSNDRGGNNRGGDNRYGNDRGGDNRSGYQNRGRGGDNRGSDRGNDRGNSNRSNEGFDTSRW
jgi:RNA recognition motif-containing protein